MTASAFETMLAHIVAVLTAAVPAVQGRVYRGLVDDLDPALCPMLIVRRMGTAPHDALIHGDGVHDLGFSVAAVVVGDDWETSADALHQAAHLALTSDRHIGTADLVLGPTEASGRAGDRTAGAITAGYTVTVQPDDDLT